MWDLCLVDLAENLGPSKSWEIYTRRSLWGLRGLRVSIAIVSMLLPWVLVLAALSQAATLYSHSNGRPSYEIAPKHPYRPLPKSPARTRTCVVKSHNDSVTDDSQYFLNALHECNNGGHVLLPTDSKYVIGTALNLTFLNHIDIGMRFYERRPRHNLLTFIHRAPRLSSVYQRYRLLASSFFSPNLSERDNLLAARRQ